MSMESSSRKSEKMQKDIVHKEEEAVPKMKSSTNKQKQVIQEEIVEPVKMISQTISQSEKLQDYMEIKEEVVSIKSPK